MANGIAVLYRWRLHPGREETFREAWKTITLALHSERGSWGSRLHRAEDGTFWAYARWPDRETLMSSRGLPSVDVDASRTMQDCISESFDDVLLVPTDDALAEPPPPSPRT